ncbi:organ-specific protein P4-like [Salvia divinorum]|uniref:Organ-specific protein P4-like n=1 Tax=Salvia divinorum TaxID=28513 RepID=A0ABD1HDI9_SALDI
MKTGHFSSLLLLFLASLVCVGGARRGPEEYWKSTMSDEAMPKAIHDLMSPNPTSDSIDLDRFIKNFETKPNVIIYHSEQLKPQALKD